MSSGTYHTCALRSDTKIVCWGDNSHGESTPTPISGDLDYVDLSAGYYHGCAIISDLTVACWGDNSFGQSSVPAGLVLGQRLGR